MTFGLVYAFNENFVLPLSHDEVVHGKGSLLGKMPGDRWQKFANLRAYYGFMFGHPGKKLLFMGCEFAQEREWNHDRSLDWHLLDDPLHAGVQRLVRDLNRLYRDQRRRCTSATSTADGFEWIDARATPRTACSASCAAAGRRRTLMLVVCNFTPVVHHGYRVGVPRAGRWRERLNTDSAALRRQQRRHAAGRGRRASPWPATARPHSIADRPAAAGHRVLRMGRRRRRWR